MFCPNCGAEFRDGFTECDECQVPLAAEIPVLPEPPHDVEPVVLATYMSLPEARVAASSLRGAGFNAWLWHDRVSSLNWLWMQALGGVKLVVPSKDQEEAARFLADEEASPNEPLVLSESHPIRQRMLWTRIVTVLVLLLMFLPLGILVGLIVLTDFAHSRVKAENAAKAAQDDPDDADES